MNSQYLKVALRIGLPVRLNSLPVQTKKKKDIPSSFQKKVTFKVQCIIVETPVKSNQNEMRNINNTHDGPKSCR